MNGKIKTTTAFNAFRACRADKANASKTLVVKSVNKDGSVSKRALTQIEWQRNAFGGPDAAAKAEARKAELEKLNPGSRYVVVEA